MRLFFHNLWQRLLVDLGLRKTTGPRVFSLDATLLRSVQDLAELEQRPEEEITAELVAYALARRVANVSSLADWEALSPREQQVAALACLGYTNRQIASRLILSPDTVKSHMRSILHKFNIHSKSQLRQALADWDFSAWDNDES
jgi:DNA-binding CsgD family transcriptional regulator